MKDSTESIAADIASGEAVLRIIRTNQAWYYTHSLHDASLAETWSVGVDPKTGGGTYGEWEVNWRELGGEVAMRVEVFHDAFKVMMAVPGWWETLAANESASPDELMEALARIGFVDMTDRKGPSWAQREATR